MQCKYGEHLSPNENFACQVMQRIPFGRNSQENKNRRAMFVTNFVSLLQMGFTPIFVDEMGANLWTVPHRGRAPRGQRVPFTSSTVPSWHMTLVAAMSPVDEIVYHEILEKPMNGASWKVCFFFNSFGDKQNSHSTPQLFVLNLKNAIHTKYPGHKFFMVMDNLRAHVISALDLIWLPAGHSFLFLLKAGKILHARKMPPGSQTPPGWWPRCCTTFPF